MCQQSSVHGRKGPCLSQFDFFFFPFLPGFVLCPKVVDELLCSHGADLTICQEEVSMQNWLGFLFYFPFRWKFDSEAATVHNSLLT